MARKFIRSKYVVFLKYHIVGDAEKSDKSKSSPKIPIIPTFVSPLTIHDDHRGGRENNNNSSVKPVEQAPPEPLTPPIET